MHPYDWAFIPITVSYIMRTEFILHQGRIDVIRYPSTFQ